MNTRPRALVLLAEGAEEMEVTITVDVLRRAEIEVVLAGLSGPQAVSCSRHMRILPDTSLDEALKQAPFEVVVLPGGAKGAERLASSVEVGNLLREQAASGRYIAAICAAPTALVQHQVGAKHKLTSHPSVAERVKGHGEYCEDPVVVDGQLITSRGPGTSFLFALMIIERLKGSDAAAKVRAPMMLAS